MPDEDAPRMLAVDVARFGNDASVILPRTMNKIHQWHTFYSIDTAKLGDLVMEKYRDFIADFIGIDAIGLGAGTVDFIRNKYQNPKNLFEVNVSERSSEPEKFTSLRDELWWRVRENCRKSLYDFPDIKIKVGGIDVHLGEELCNELALPTYEFIGGGEGKIKVESKKSMRMRGKNSPNIADALCISEYFNGTMQVLTQKSRNIKPKPRSPEKDLGRYGWMVL
jgi:hypothetical protein